ncbi:MAG: thiamine pyrophosphate-requiring protein [Alphaproteobacteria bacterium]|nr:MAG: thiamine pyrophosphate-requiring protein [Alphaproteobacteria bacterium]
MNGADILAQILKAEGTEFVAGFPENRLFNSAAALDIRPLIARTERVAINMADAYTRVNNGKKIGVVAVQDGPGIEASFGAIAQAYGDNTPILALPGAYFRAQQGYAPHFDGARSFRDVTKWSATINEHKDIARHIERAFALLKNGRGGPVLLETAKDVLWGSYEGEMPSYSSPKARRSQGDLQDVKETLEALLAAKRPVLVAGNGIFYAEAWEELREFAELVQVPVMTTQLGKSAFPETHPLALGNGGRTVPTAVGHFATNADFILGIGTSFTINDFTARMPKGKTLGQITNDAADVGKCYATEYGIIGDAKLVLQQLIAEAKDVLGENGRARNEALEKEILEMRHAFLEEWMPRLTCDEPGPISPYRVIWEMNQCIDKANSIVTHDAGNPRDQITPFYEATQPRGYLSWGKSTHLGSSLGLILGAKLARPEALCVNLIGDAGFGMSGMDYETAARLELPIMTVLLNNGVMGGYGAYMPEAVSNFSSNRVTGDYAGVASALGGYSERVEKPEEVRPALLRGIEETRKGRPVLLEMITREEPVLPMANKWGM